MSRLHATVAVLVVAGLAASPSPMGGQEASVPPLFASHDVLPVTFTADFRQLERDRRTSPDREAVVTVAGPDGNPVQIAARLRTRGQFRLDASNCSFPPLRLDVRARDAEGTVFDGQDELKVVSSCRPGRARYDRLVVLEYLAYRAHALVTDASFRVRPLSLTFVDESGSSDSATRFAFLIEDDEPLAARLGATRYDLPEGQVLPPASLQVAALVTTALFQYMIGNADWSAVAGHNVEILDLGGGALPVPYDFDFSGLVDAPYATPPESLGLRNVRERVYRGWCTADFVALPILQRFREAREGILGLFADAEGLEPDERRKAVRYLDEFFEQIETDDRARRHILRDCRTRVP